MTRVMDNFCICQEALVNMYGNNIPGSVIFIPLCDRLASNSYVNLWFSCFSLLIAVYIKDSCFICTSDVTLIQAVSKY